MKRFKNILVVFNKYSKNNFAFTQATKLAASNNAKLTALEIIEEIPYYLKKIVEKERKNTLIQMINNISSEIVPNAKILTGKAFVEIIREVVTNKHDLVIMEPLEPIDYSSRIFSSLSMHLLRKCPCPVWIIRPEQTSSQKHKVLAAIDAKNGDNLNHQMNTTIMQLAHSLSITEGYELHIAHAWKHPWEEIMMAEVEMTKKEKFKAIYAVRNKRKEYLDNLVNSLNLDKQKYKIHLEKGEPLVVIPRIIAQQKIDLIVMGTVTRPSLIGIIMGNTCEDILQQVNCSVLALKPEGFQTPIKLI